MGVRVSAAALVAAWLAATATGQAATVQVRVLGVRNDHGHILVALCTRADFLRPHCPFHAKAAATPGQVLVTIPDVPPGTYAAQAFHDEDDNGRLKRSLLGLPEEAMGFSNDAPMRMGPPRFDDAAFAVGAGGARIAFTLHYY
jgi:uncharacterized protein (DUF2141 family)